MKRIPIWTVVIGLCVMGTARAEKNLVVDLSKSTVYAFDDGRLVRSLVINPGSSQTPTRPGRYRISQKVRKGYRSNLVNMHNKPLKKGELGAPMDYWMRLGGTGMGFHRSSLWRASGNWGSHGCLRMSRAGARWLFDWAPEGTPVAVRSGGVDLASATRSRKLGGDRVEVASYRTRVHPVRDRVRRVALLKRRRPTLTAQREDSRKIASKLSKERPTTVASSKHEPESAPLKPAVDPASSKPLEGPADPTTSRVHPIGEEQVKAPGEKD